MEDSEILPDAVSPNGDLTNKEEGTNSSLKTIDTTRETKSTSKNDFSQKNKNETKIGRKIITNGPDNQTLLRLLEQGEQLHSMFRCARIQGLDTIEGLLLFGRDHYYVVDGFTLLKTREIRDLDFLPEQ